MTTYYKALKNILTVKRGRVLKGLDKCKYPKDYFKRVTEKDYLKYVKKLGEKN